MGQHGVAIRGARVDQLLPGRLIVPVDLRLGRGRIIVAGADQPPQLGLQHRVGHLQQTPDGRTDQRDGVHGGHRVIQRRGIQHPLGPHQTRRPGHLHAAVEDPPLIGRPIQPGPEIHQHRMRETAPPATVITAHPRRVAPAGIEAVALHRLPIRQPLQTLQDHHRGHHRRRHTAPPQIGEQIREHLVGEQPVALAVQQRVDRVLRQRLVTETIHVIEHTGLAIRHPQAHRAPRNQNPMPVTLADPVNERQHLRPRKTPPT